jgi:hypothetical protein
VPRVLASTRVVCFFPPFLALLYNSNPVYDHPCQVRWDIPDDRSRIWPIANAPRAAQRVSSARSSAEGGLEFLTYSAYLRVGGTQMKERRGPAPSRGVLLPSRFEKMRGVLRARHVTHSTWTFTAHLLQIPCS